jgi:hypothetical protein
MNMGTHLKSGAIILVFVAGIVSIAAGRTIYVDADGPADFNTIQDAINFAEDGDVVIVTEGRYFELINLKGKDITLRSREPNNLDVVAETIIDGGAGSSVAVMDNSGEKFNPRVVTFNSGEGPDCVVNGFTITKGRSAGVYCEYSSPTLTNCIISKNFSGGASGGMYCNNSSPKLINCTFSRNSGHVGGGIYSNKSKPVLIKCTFAENSAWQAGAMSASEGSIVNLYNCIFTRNFSGSHAGAILTGLKGSAWTVTNCTFVANSARDCGGAIYHSTTGKVIITNCIFWDNNARGLERGLQDLAQISLHAAKRPTIRYCCIQGLDVLDDMVDGIGNTLKNPIFADPNKGDYHLRSKAGRWHPKKRSWIQDDVTSPCIDAGDPNIPVGQEPLPNGSRINMGAYGGTSEASKSQFDQPVFKMIVAGNINGDYKVKYPDFTYGPAVASR